MKFFWKVLIAKVILFLIVPLVGGGEVPPVEAQGLVVQGSDVQGPFVSEPVTPGVSQEVRRLPIAEPWKPGDPIRILNPRQLGNLEPGNTGGGIRTRDPLLQDATSSSLLKTPAPAFSFEGMSLATGGSGVPPDTIGDVGPNHYVQMVNTSFAVYDKQGNRLAGPTAINQLWQGQGNPCETQNDGDPIVLYDRLADRWLLSQFAHSHTNPGPPPWYECIAISQTPDPMGGYFLYAFPITDAFPDYPKLGVWPDAYYMATNDAAPNVGVFAFDRTNMLAGTAATSQKFTVVRNFMLPSDLDGTTLPATGSPNYFYTMMDDTVWPTTFGIPGSDRLEIWEFKVDFNNSANSTFTLADTLPTTSFNYLVCELGVFDCIPQPAPGEGLDAIAEWPMWRLQYRNFSTHETLVGNFTVEVDGTRHAGIRWFELRKTGGGSWSISQEGTHAPDANQRWMGSIAMDKDGNIALGYSVSGNSLNPSIRYATRDATDPLGTLQTETTLIAGSGVQTGGGNRWGDYSSMNVDPADDCTFWYTNEYYATTASVGWSTRIGSFRLQSCGAVSTPVLSVSPTSRDFGSVQVGSSADQTFSASNTGGGTLTGSATTTTPFSLVSGGSFSLAAGQSQTVTVRFSPTSAGTFMGTVSFSSDGGSTSPAVTGTGTAAGTSYTEVSGNGLTVNSPAAVVEGSTVHLFVRGTNDRIYLNTRTAGTWSGYSEVPGGGLTLSQPAAVLDSSGNLRLYVQGINNRIYVNTRTGSTWSGYSEVPGGGLTPNGPEAVLEGSQVQLFVRGVDDRIYTITP